MPILDFDPKILVSYHIADHFLKLKNGEIKGNNRQGSVWVNVGVIIPVILNLWAKFTRNIVTIRLPVNLLTGYILLITGGIFVCSAIWNLWRSETGAPVTPQGNQSAGSQVLLDDIMYAIWDLFSLYKKIR